MTSFVPAVLRLPTSSTLVLTAGLLTFFVGVTLVVWGNQPYALPPFSGEAPLVLGSLRIPTQGLWLAGISAAIIGGFWLLLHKTRLGCALRACAENPAAARLMGIDLPRMMLLSFGLAALTGSICGILVAPLMSLQFNSGQFFTISGFIAVAIGGMGSFAGSVAGGLLLGVSEQFAAYYVSSLFANTLALAAAHHRPHPAACRPVSERAAAAQRRARRGPGPSRAGSPAGPACPDARRRAGRRHGRCFPLLPLPGGVLSTLVIALILFIAVLGLDVLMGYAGQVSLGQAGFMAVGGYAAAILSTTYDWPPLLGTLAALVLSVLCAFGLALATGRLRGHYLALATLAFGLLVDSLTVNLIDLTGGPSGLVGIPAFAIGGFEFSTPAQMYYLVLALGGRARAPARRRHAVRASGARSRRCAPISWRPPRWASMSAG